MEDALDQAMSLETRLRSFVVRFVSTEACADAARPMTDWYGVIRHVQSNSERHFTRWDEALEFMSQYVDLRQPDRQS